MTRWSSRHRRFFCLALALDLELGELAEGHGPPFGLLLRLWVLVMGDGAEDVACSLAGVGQVHAPWTAVERVSDDEGLAATMTRLSQGDPSRRSSLVFHSPAFEVSILRCVDRPSIFYQKQTR